MPSTLTVFKYAAFVLFAALCIYGAILLWYSVAREDVSNRKDLMHFERGGVLTDLVRKEMQKDRTDDFHLESDGLYHGQTIVKSGKFSHFDISENGEHVAVTKQGKVRMSNSGVEAILHKGYVMAWGKKVRGESHVWVYDAKSDKEYLAITLLTHVILMHDGRILQEKIIKTNTSRTYSGYELISRVRAKGSALYVITDNVRFFNGFLKPMYNMYTISDDTANP